MSRQSFVVVYTPHPQPPFSVVGAVLEGPTAARATETGVVLLPFDADREANLLDGFYCRSFGLTRDRPVIPERCVARCAPMLMHVVPEQQFLHWVAVLVPSGDYPVGSLRLVVDTPPGVTQTAGLAAGNDAVYIEHLTRRPDGLLVARGKRRLQVGDEGWIALSLYVGGVDGVKLATVACSQSSNDVTFS